MNEDSATATMIRAMEEFSVSEPKAVLIVFMCEDGSVKFSSNIDGPALKLGLLDFARAMILNRAFCA